MQDGKAYLINCMISSNTANPSFSPLSTAALKVESGRVWLGNGTRFANNSFKVEAAEVIYVLPAPPGHYTNARKCEVVYTSCPDGCSNDCIQNRSLKAASTAINCTQPPYNIQSCPWNMGLAANSFGEEILGLLLELAQWIFTSSRLMKFEDLVFDAAGLMVGSSRWICRLSRMRGF